MCKYTVFFVRISLLIVAAGRKEPKATPVQYNPKCNPSPIRFYKTAKKHAVPTIPVKTPIYATSRLP